MIDQICPQVCVILALAHASPFVSHSLINCLASFQLLHSHLSSSLSHRHSPLLLCNRVPSSTGFEQLPAHQFKVDGFLQINQNTQGNGNVFNRQIQQELNEGPKLFDVSYQIRLFSFLKTSFQTIIHFYVLEMGTLATLMLCLRNFLIHSQQSLRKMKNLNRHQRAQP